MPLPSKLVSVARGIARGARTAGRAVKTAALAVKEHPSHALAVSWIAGMGTFSVVTVQRARAVAAAEDSVAAVAPSKGSASDGPGETVMMMDVEQMEKLRIARMHANGLSASGEADEPTKQMIDDARAELAKGVEVDGEVAGTAGKIRIVSKGGLAGWIKRNKGKKADPETLAWLRGEEAREGGPAYAGWVDRGDGDILNYALDRKHGGNGLGGRGSARDALGSGMPTMAEVEAAANGSAVVAANGSAVPVAGGPTAVASGSATVTATGSAIVAARDPVDLRVAAGAAISALARSADAAKDPSEAERAGLVAKLHAALGADAPAVVIRDHHLVALLLADRMFRNAELTGEGKAIVHALANQLGAMPDRAFVIGADAETAMETAGYLLISGIDEDRMAIRTKAMDPAINLVEVEIIPLPGGGFVQGAAR